MDQTVVRVQKTDLKAHTDYELAYIVQKHPHFLDCTFDKQGDEIVFTYDTTYSSLISECKQFSMMCRYRILLSLKSFIERYMYDISLNPCNLFVDHSFQIQVMQRDISDVYYHIDCQQFKALIGYLLQDKYAYEDFYFGGMDLLKENELTKNFYQMETVDEIMDELEKRVLAEEEKETHYVHISQKQWYRVRILNHIFKVVSVVLILLFAYFGVYRLYREYLFNQSLQAYIQQDYLQVIEVLENVKVSHMNKNILAIVAEATVKSESLTTEQKNNILSHISIHSDQKLLEYWIYIGRNEAEQAVDLAQQLNNQEYLAYAYMKKQEEIENDSSMNFQEKQKAINEIESQLKKIEQESQ